MSRLLAKHIRHIFMSNIFNYFHRYGPGGVNNAVSSSQQQSAATRQQQYEQQPTNHVISTTNSTASEQQPLHLTISHSPEQQHQLGSPVATTTSLWDQWDGDNGTAWGVAPATTPQSHSPSSTAQLWHESWQLVSHGGDAQLYGQSEQYGNDGDSSTLW